MENDLDDGRPRRRPDNNNPSRSSRLGSSNEKVVLEERDEGTEEVGGGGGAIENEEEATPTPLVTHQERRLPRPSLQFRTKKPGYWTVCLLPLAIYFADQRFLHQSLPAVAIITYNSCLLVFFHSSGGTGVLVDYLKHLKGLNAALGAATVLYGYSVYTNKELLYEYILWAGLNFSFPYAFRNLVKYYPKSFSFGEGILVTSTFIYTFWASFHNIIQSNFATLDTSPDPVILTILQQLAFLTAVLIVRGILLIAKPQRFFVLQELYTIAAKGGVANLFYKFPNAAQETIFLMNWSVAYFIYDVKHAVYLIWWSLLVSITIFFVLNSIGQVTSNVHRKFFHLLMCLVYFPVILEDLNFIFFCSVCLLYAFVLVEALRVLNFELWGFKFGEMINSCVTNFRDRQDKGPLLLTPIYLLAGCSAPIWLTGLYVGATSRNNEDRTPEELAAAITGILSIGVGDTIASLAGPYGHYHWPGSHKTIEGTMCSVLAQTMTVFLLCASGRLPYTIVSLTALCISVVVNALAEAMTTQIDNLVIPLVAFNTVHIVIYLTDFLYY